MQIRLLRHATLVMRMGSVCILTDPMLSRMGAMDPVQNAATQARIPLVELSLDDAALTRLFETLHGVLVTHLHRDHFDARAVEILPKGLPMLCQPVDVEAMTRWGFRQVLAVEAEREWCGVRVARTGGRHGTGEVGAQMGIVSGFVLRAPGEPCVYLAGDTIWCTEVEEALRHHRPDVIVVNAGAAQFLTGAPITMTAEDVVAVCRAAPEATVVAVHMGAINHCLLSRAALGLALADAGVLDQVWIPANGETLTFPLHEP